MDIIINENQLDSIIPELFNFLFDGFDDVYYDWANYYCGMGECCDPYAIGFVLPKHEYDDYMFKLIDSNHYNNEGDYPKELSDDLPEVCYDTPDIKDPRFDMFLFYEDYFVELKKYVGNTVEVHNSILSLLNRMFGLQVTKLIIL